MPVAHYIHHKRCCYCERVLLPGEVTKEHIIPKSRGGRITRPCCLTCNREKKNMMLIEYVCYLQLKLRVVRKADKVNRVKRQLRNAIKYLLALYPGEYDFIYKH